MKAYILYFWHTHLAGHFDEEEKLLFKNAEETLNKQAIMEHRQLHFLVDEISGSATFQNLNVFANLLEKHIRFEERILFPYLETVIPPNELLAIGKQLEELHSGTATDDFADEFWV
ncbi:hypothetical protein GCM10027516_29840 [Niabella aquatica]